MGKGESGNRRGREVWVKKRAPRGRKGERVENIGPLKEFILLEE
jgi:hypothetical protein